MNILVTLCGRGGSKGIPGKNIKMLSGKPLIAYSIKHAQQLIEKFGGDIALSTDSNEIINVASEYGVKSNYKRPPLLATDSIGKIDVIDDVLIYMESNNKRHYDYVIDLDITSPLRHIDDLIAAFQLLISDEKALNIFSVSEASRNPYFNMVEIGNDDYARLVKVGDFRTRQSSPKVYDMNASFYIYRRAFFSQNLKSAVTDSSLIYVMEHICFDIDEPLDFKIMDYLLSNNLLGFDL